MLGQSGLALALDGERLPDRAGSLTPATALGTVLVDRLRAAGHTYEVARSDAHPHGALDAAGPPPAASHPVRAVAPRPRCRTASGALAAASGWAGS